VVRWQKFATGFLVDIGSQASMHDAQAQCLAIGGGLATVQTQAEAANFMLVRKSPSSGYYIGATDETVEGQFKWLSGANWTEPVPFWAPGQPNNTLGTQDCVELDGQLWYTIECSEVRHFICEYVPLIV